jgi:hypothetical protein
VPLRDRRSWQSMALDHQPLARPCWYWAW